MYQNSENFQQRFICEIANVKNFFPDFFSFLENEQNNCLFSSTMLILTTQMFIWQEQVILCQFNNEKKYIFA